MTIDLGEPWEIPEAFAPYLACIRACAAICLGHHKHPQQVPMEVEGEFPRSMRLAWTASTQEQQDTMGEATAVPVIEMGAECIALKVAMHCLNLDRLKVASKGSGIDFYLGSSSQPGPAFQGLVRLEISGILETDRPRYGSRIRKKLRQMAPSDSQGPGYAAVVMFGPPATSMTKRI